MLKLHIENRKDIANERMKLENMKLEKRNKEQKEKRNIPLSKDFTDFIKEKIEFYNNQEKK